MKVAAVIPHWNRRDLLRALLGNLSQQTRAFDEVIVADNGSEDDSAEVAEQAGARVIRLGRNQGFAEAVNRGVEGTRADWVAILNNDVELAPTWLARMEVALQNDGEASFAAGKILSVAEPDGAEPSRPSRIDATFDEISRGACAWRCGAGRMDGPLWNKPRTIRMAPMTAAMFRRDLFDRVGLLDVEFESYLEDIDFGLRCNTFDTFGIYVPDAVAWHQGSATRGAWHSNTVRLISRNQILLAAKHFRGLPVWPIVAGQLLWGLVALRHARGFAYVQGKIEGLRMARRIRKGRAGRFGQSGLAGTISDSENEIFAIQQQTGFDSYWRAYFWLSGR